MVNVQMQLQAYRRHIGFMVQICGFLRFQFFTSVSYRVPRDAFGSGCLLRSASCSRHDPPLAAAVYWAALLACSGYLLSGSRLPAIISGATLLAAGRLSSGSSESRHLLNSFSHLGPLLSGFSSDGHLVDVSSRSGHVLTTFKFSVRGSLHDQLGDRTSIILVQSSCSRANRGLATTNVLLQYPEVRQLHGRAYAHLQRGTQMRLGKSKGSENPLSRS